MICRRSTYVEGAAVEIPASSVPVPLGSTQQLVGNLGSMSTRTEPHFGRLGGAHTTTLSVIVFAADTDERVSIDNTIQATVGVSFAKAAEAWAIIWVHAIEANRGVEGVLRP